MQEIYRELGYAPKKVGWRFGIIFFTMIVILFILIGISVVASIPIFVRRQIESFMGGHINNRLGYFSGRRNGSE